MDRRRFLIVSAAAGGGLVVSVAIGRRRPGTGERRPPDAAWHEANAFVEISTDGAVRIGAPVPEVGQGVSAALPLLVARELRVDPASVTVWRPPADERYGAMSVAGSDAVVDYWEPLRMAGATARSALIGAAARRWDVDPARCEARRGEVLHTESHRSLGYGELAAEAVEAVPAEVDLGPWPADGVESAAYDPELEEIVTGRARFGLDVRPEGLHFAVVARPPVRGQRPVSFDREAALAVPGVVHVAPIESLVIQDLRYGAVRGGVAVIARTTWAAMRGRDALDVQWEGAVSEPSSDAALFGHMRDAVERAPERVVRSVGDAPPPRLEWIERRYELPLLAHGCLEPVNFTARVTEGRCEAIGPSQNPRFLRALVGAALGLEPQAVTVEHTRIGGGFGRRLAVDYGVEAALVARTLPGRWVQVVWTREDDLTQDYYRPPSVHRLRAGLARDGRLAAWEHHLVTSSLARHTFGPDAPDPAVYDVQGADYVPLEASWVRLGHSSVDVPLQLGSLRSVAHSFNVFAVASFLDEIAEARGMDPLAFHRELLGPPRTVDVRLALPGRRGLVRVDTGRLRRVVDAVAEAASWRRAVPPGTGRGLAWSVYKGTYVAHVAEVSATGAERPRVSRIAAAIDCGTVVDPNGVRAQVEGAAMDGVASVLHWRTTYADGRAVAHNFDGFPLLRMSEAPVVETVLVPSGDPPTGMGEPPYPSVPPSVTAAIAAATGRRHRRLPIID